MIEQNDNETIFIGLLYQKGGGEGRRKRKLKWEFGIIPFLVLMEYTKDPPPSLPPSLISELVQI